MSTQARGTVPVAAAPQVRRAEAGVRRRWRRPREASKRWKREEPEGAEGVPEFSEIAAVRMKEPGLLLQRGRL